MKNSKLYLLHVYNLESQRLPGKQIGLMNSSSSRLGFGLIKGSPSRFFTWCGEPKVIRFLTGMGHLWTKPLGNDFDATLIMNVQCFYLGPKSLRTWSRDHPGWYQWRCIRSPSVGLLAIFRTPSRSRNDDNIIIWQYGDYLRRLGTLWLFGNSDIVMIKHPSEAGELDK